MRSFIERNLVSVLNQYLALDPESKARIALIKHKVVTIELLGIPLRFQFIFTESTIEIAKSLNKKPDTIIKGTPLSLLHMTLQKEDRKRFFADDVTIEGDIELGQKVIDLFDSIEIDYEEYLARWIGDIPAREVGRLVRKLRAVNQNLNMALRDNLNEYLHEEINLCPTKEALSDFFHDVDHLRLDVDRIDARLQQLLPRKNLKKEV